MPNLSFFHVQFTSPCREDEHMTAMNEGCELKDGVSSSNSTVEEISDEKNSSARPYVRSKLPRLRWTPDLRLLFELAVGRLGGQERATPKLVLQLMNIEGLNIAHVKSHLQMFRSKKIEEPHQGIIDHRLLQIRINRNIYNPRQLPTLSSFHQRNQYSNFRYSGDASWKVNGKWMDDNSTIGQGNTYNKTIPGFYSIRRRIFSSHCFRPENLDFCTRIRSYEDPEDEFGSLHKQETKSCQSRKQIIELNSLKRMSDQPPSSSQQVIMLRKEMGFKREAKDCELDLNLSLMLESRDDMQQRFFHGEEDLSLSLYGTRSSPKQIIKKMKQDFTSENKRSASTLDLTL